MKLDQQELGKQALKLTAKRIKNITPLEINNMTPPQKKKKRMQELGLYVLSLKGKKRI